MGWATRTGPILCATPARMTERGRHTGDRRRGAGPAPYFARLRYSPVRVSTATISPMLTNGGTVILRPVSSVAGLYCAAAVAPLTDGSVSVTFSSTVAGRSRLIGLLS